MAPCCDGGHGIGDAQGQIVVGMDADLGLGLQHVAEQLDPRRHLFRQQGARRSR